MSSDSKKAVAAAICGNFVVMVAKFVGFALSGSGAMLSEGIHSVADVLNQVLLMVGLVRGAKNPDETHPYGYSGERYVWALISAVGIFFLGCGVTVYHGVFSLMHPHELGDLTWSFAILGLSLAIEGSVLTLALSGLRKAAGGRPFLTFLNTEADTSAVAVLLEDSAACLGILIAASGLGLSYVTGEVYWDAIGSIAIGLLLGAVAVWLIWRNHHQLVGPAVPLRAQRQVRAIIENSNAVEHIVKFRSRMLDTETYDFEAEIEFDGKALAKVLEPSLEEAYNKIDSYEDFRDFASQYADDVVELLGDEVDALEKRVREVVPEAKYVDLEAN